MPERTIEFENNRYISANEFWPKFIDGRHPEILAVSIAKYNKRPHGDGSGAFIDFAFFQSSSFDYTFSLDCGEVLAINSIVDVCSDSNCKHFSEDHISRIAGDWLNWHNCDSDLLNIDNPKSFIFLDMEFRGNDILELVKTSLSEDYDYYVFDSGGGLHVVIDKLVDPINLSIEYGKIIKLFGTTLGNFKLFDLGENLVRSGRNISEIRKWSESVLRSYGHCDEDKKLCKDVSCIDVRHVAHSLLRLCDGLEDKRGSNNLFGAASLRLSPSDKYGNLSPALIYAKEGDLSKSFENPFPNSSKLFKIDGIENLQTIISQSEKEYLKMFNPLYPIGENNVSVDEIFGSENWKFFLRTRIFSLFVTMDAAACNGSVDTNYLIGPDNKLTDLNTCFKLMGLEEVPYDDKKNPLNILFDLKIRSLQAMEILEDTNLEKEMSDKTVIFKKDVSGKFSEVKEALDKVIDDNDVWGVYGSAIKNDNPGDVDIVIIANDLNVDKYIKIVTAISKLNYKPKISPQIIPLEYFWAYWSSDDYDLFTEENFVLMGGADELEIPQRQTDYVNRNKLFNTIQNLLRIKKGLGSDGFEALLKSEAKANHTLKQVAHFRKKLMDSLNVELPDIKTYEKWKISDGEYYLRRKIFEAYWDMKKMIYLTRSRWMEKNPSGYDSH